MVLRPSISNNFLNKFLVKSEVNEKSVKEDLSIISVINIYFNLIYVGKSGLVKETITNLGILCKL